MFFININVAVSLWNRERNMDIPSSGVKKKNKYKKEKEIKEPKKNLRIWWRAIEKYFPVEKKNERSSLPKNMENFF